MQTVNFTCSHCGNLIAADQTSLGRQVRCPYCQQVVMAPPSDLSSAQLEPTVTSPLPVPGPRDIVRAPETTDSALFDQGSQAQQESQTPPYEKAPASAEVTLPSPLSPTLFGPLTESVPSKDSFPFAPAASVANPPPGATETETNAQRVSFEEASAATALMRPSATPHHGGSLGSRLRGIGTTPLLIVPLVSYAILATATIVWLLLQPKPPHPLEMIPDLEGENKGAKHVSGSSQTIKLPRADIPLPTQLRASLGQTVQIGDVEVTPKKVQRGRLRFRTEGYAEIVPAAQDSLLLWLHVRNASSNVLFKPMDPFFDRRWKKEAPVGVMPFTFLVMGQRCFYGGPLDYWKAHSVRRDPRHAEPRESLEGQNYDRELKPGEKLATFVCTDPDDRAVQALENYQGPLLWRVQVRRGLVAYGQREFSATAVIGIEFHSQDVQKEAN